MPRLDDEAQQARLEAASVRLRKRLVLLHWLTQGCCYSVDILNFGTSSGIIRELYYRKSLKKPS